MTTKQLLFTEEQLPQRSEEWLEFRNGGLGGSEIPVIMGDIPVFWRSPYDLFLQKLGKPQPAPTKAMLWGTKHEGEALKVLKEYLDVRQEDEEQSKKIFEVDNHCNYTPKFKTNIEHFTAIYPKFQHIFTSFDGVDRKNKVIFEIKCPSQKNFEKIYKKKEIPKYYTAQVQAQLMVANAHWKIRKAIFVNFYPEGIKVYNPETEGVKLVKLTMIEVKLDEEYCKLLVKKCESFWDMVYKKMWNNEWEEVN